MLRNRKNHVKRDSSALSYIFYAEKKKIRRSLKKINSLGYSPAEKMVVRGGGEIGTSGTFTLIEVHLLGSPSSNCHNSQQKNEGKFAVCLDIVNTRTRAVKYFCSEVLALWSSLARMYLTNIPTQDTFNPKALTIPYVCYVFFFPYEYNVLIIPNDSSSQDKLKVRKDKLWKKLFSLTKRILWYLECP